MEQAIKLERLAKAGRKHKNLVKAMEWNIMNHLMNIISFLYSYHHIN